MTTIQIISLVGLLVFQYICILVLLRQKAGASSALVYCQKMSDAWQGVAVRRGRRIQDLLTERAKVETSRDAWRAYGKTWARKAMARQLFIEHYRTELHKARLQRDSWKGLFDQATVIASQEVEKHKQELARVQQGETGPQPWKDALAGANSLLRTVNSIVERRGKRTDWESFAPRLTAVLLEQHKLMHPGSYPKQPESPLTPQHWES